MDSSTLQKTLKDIEDSISENALAIERAEDLKSLKLDKRFQSVIIDGYINDESKRLFDILTDPSGASPYSKEKINLLLEAISHFKSYIGTDGYEGTVDQDAMYALDANDKEREFRKKLTAEAAEEEE